MASAALTHDDIGLRTVFEAVMQAWREGDATAFSAHYASEATVILPGIHLRGSAVIQASMAEAFAGPLKDTRRIHQVEHIRFLDDTTALVTTRSGTTLPGEPEPAADRWSLATWVLSRSTGPWLVEAYHDSPTH
jgi:uncharacterized protein (TIGR02246 family)